MRTVRLAKNGRLLAEYVIEIRGEPDAPEEAYVQEAISRALDDGAVEPDDYDAVFTLLRTEN